MPMRVSTALFPPISPLQSGQLRVSALHSIYWETIGSREGVPIVFLHGGPGSGCSPKARQFFNPAKAYVTLFDQRGCGRSSPLAETEDNNTEALISDIERLRIMLGIEKWIVFGGSWGSTLALAYGQAHPERCVGFVLRGVFLGTSAETRWFIHEMGQFQPEAAARFLNFLPSHERADPLTAYRSRLRNPDATVHLPAAHHWAAYENACATLASTQQLPNEPKTADRFALGIASLEAHYMGNDCFLAPNQLLENMHKIDHLPATIIQGRYDVICPPRNAYMLAQAWRNAKLMIVSDGAHSAHEPAMERALVEAVRDMVTRAG